LSLRRKYTIVEDGDRKGFQSNKGLAAKKEVRISTLKLSPRSPGLMVLDYVIWEKVDAKMQATSPTGRESKDAFVTRLKKCAKSVCTKAFLTKHIGKMKGRLQSVVKSGGYNPPRD
jgi:hypothetical protein